MKRHVNHYEMNSKDKAKVSFHQFVPRGDLNYPRKSVKHQGNQHAFVEALVIFAELYELTEVIIISPP